MQNLVVPISDLVSYLDDTLDLWPLGYAVEPSGSSRNEVLVNAAAEFAKAYIQVNMRHLRRKPDPVENLLRALGYPIKVMSEAEVDELCNAVDDLYLNLMLVMDPYLDTILRTIGNRGVEFRHLKFTEDLIVEVKADPIVERYKELMRKVRQLSPPKVVREIDDLEEYGEYFDHCLNEVFGSIHNQAIRDEVKRMLLERLSRQ